MLAAFRRLLPVPTSLSSQDQYKLHIPELKNTIKWVAYRTTPHFIVLLGRLWTLLTIFFIINANRSLGASVIVMSNPRNPTGQVIKGEELEELVEISRTGVTLVWGFLTFHPSECKSKSANWLISWSNCRLDEFYSWYQYSPELEGKSVSSAAYVEGQSWWRSVSLRKDRILTHWALS